MLKFLLFVFYATFHNPTWTQWVPHRVRPRCDKSTNGQPLWAFILTRVCLFKAVLQLKTGRRWKAPLQWLSAVAGNKVRHRSEEQRPDGGNSFHSTEKARTPCYKAKPVSSTWSETLPSEPSGFFPSILRWVSLSGSCPWCWNEDRQPVVWGRSCGGSAASFSLF